MENNIQKEQQQREEMQIQDTYNDEYWQKKYGVSADELKATADIGIPAKIINLISKKRALTV
jgi:hypothetical protein